MDSNHRRRKPADLQSALVGHLSNLPDKERASSRLARMTARYFWREPPTKPALFTNAGHGLWELLQFVRRPWLVVALFRVNLGDFPGGDRRSGVAPFGTNISQYRGDLVVAPVVAGIGNALAENRHWHRPGKLGALDRQFSLQPIKDDPDGALLGSQHPLGTGERRVNARHAKAVGLMAGVARGVVEKLLAQLPRIDFCDDQVALPGERVLVVDVRIEVAGVAVQVGGGEENQPAEPKEQAERQQ